MKRLDEILSSSAAVDSSVTELQAPPPAPAEAPGEDGCPRCGGARFVRRARKLDDPLFGRAEPCTCVLDETGEVRRSRLERISNLGALTRFTFDALEGEATVAAAAQVRAYADEPDGWLVLKGPSGSGKTHLAAAIANERITRGEPVLFMFTPRPPRRPARLLPAGGGRARASTPSSSRSATPPSSSSTISTPPPPANGRARSSSSS